MNREHVDDAERPTNGHAQSDSGSGWVTDELLKAWTRRITRVVVRRVPPEDVEDVVQETLLAIVRALPGLRDRERAEAWVETIARRMVADFLASRDRAESSELIEDGEDHQEHQDRLEEVESREVVRGMLDGLSDGQQAALILHGVLGLPFAEVGRVLGVTRKGAESLYRRGKLKILASLAESDAF